MVRVNCQNGDGGGSWVDDRFFLENLLETRWEVSEIVCAVPCLGLRRKEKIGVKTFGAQKLKLGRNTDNSEPEFWA